MSCIALINLLSQDILQIASQIMTVKYLLLPNYVLVSLRHYLIFKVLLQIPFQIRNLIVFILGMQISNISPLLNLTTLSIFLEFVQLHPQIRFDYFCAINKQIKLRKNYLKRKWYLHKINSLMPRIRNNYECQVNRKENYWDWKS